MISSSVPASPCTMTTCGTAYSDTASSPECQGLPHSLRGLHSTIAMERGATSGVVAAALGHGSFAITARHYVSPQTLANAKTRKVAAALAGPAPRPIPRSPTFPGCPLRSPLCLPKN